MAAITTAAATPAIALLLSIPAAAPPETTIVVPVGDTVRVVLVPKLLVSDGLGVALDMMDDIRELTSAARQNVTRKVKIANKRIQAE
jgi:hypothetical protein